MYMSHVYSPCKDFYSKPLARKRAFHASTSTVSNPSAPPAQEIRCRSPTRGGVELVKRPITSERCGDVAWCP